MTATELPRPNLMKRKMAAGDLTLGMIVRVMRGVEIAALAHSACYDCVYIDLEHNSFSLETVGQIAITAAALGVTPIVRVPGLDPAFIGRTLETGAQGIIIPHMDTADQARLAVSAAKFPPLGQRSLLAINPHTLFQGGPAEEVMQAMNRATLVAGMIESVAAVENADAIAAVDGLDMLLVGTNDLCVSLGIPGQHDHPLIRDAYQTVATACRAHGKHLGVGGLNARPDVARQMIGLGAAYMSAGSDAGFLLAAAKQTAQLYR